MPVFANDSGECPSCDIRVVPLADPAVGRRITVPTHFGRNVVSWADAREERASPPAGGEPRHGRHRRTGRACPRGGTTKVIPCPTVAVASGRGAGRSRRSGPARGRSRREHFRVTFVSRSQRSRFV